MGNRPNDNFGDKLNLNEHRNKMNNLNKHYTETGLDLNGYSNGSMKAPSKNVEYKKIQRKDALYKATVLFVERSGIIQIHAQYDSQDGCELEVYIGVEEVVEDPESHLTKTIKSKLQFKQQLKKGKKNRFEKTYQLIGQNIENATIILRVLSKLNDSRSEYSFRKVKVPHLHWKILLEKYEIGGVCYQMENIYKGGEESQECIVCMAEISNTMVKPCNHLCLCKECSKLMKENSNKCPICRKGIESFVTISTVV